MTTAQKQATDNSAIGTLSMLIDEVNAHHAKQAAARPAAVNLPVPADDKKFGKKADIDGAGSGSYRKDPGFIGGKSTHPTADLDGNNHPASYGAHGAETSADIKAEIPNNVDSASTSITDQGGDYDHVQIGMKVKPTGEDPSTENDFKKSKDDPGTSSPASADGENPTKYASMSFPALYKEACAKISGLLTRLAAAPGDSKSAAAIPAKSASASTADAAAAGYALADLVNAQPDDPRLIKVAAARDVAEHILREAYEDADLAGDLLCKLAAADEEAAMAAGMGGDMGGDMGGGAPADPSQLPPEMGGGGGAMGPAQGPDPAAAAMPGAEGAGAGPEGAGGGSEDEVINELANSLVESGLPLDKLIMALQTAMAGAAGGGGEGGGAPPEAGGEPAAMAAKAAAAKIPPGDLASLLKSANAVRAHMLSGKFRKTAAKPGSSRSDDLNYLNYLREVLSIR